MVSKITGLLLLIAACAAECAIPAADTVTNSIGMKFKRIPAGTFQMGFEGAKLAPSAAYGMYGDTLFYGLYNEKPARSVTLTQPFYMGVHEVTAAQWAAFSGSGSGTLPGTGISWKEADSFCQWLTARDANHWTYRLPTEAEWEYCCRAGTATPFYSGNSSPAGNFGESWDWDVRSVGGYAANPWGLYDMFGNAGEWCLDGYGPYPAAADTNPGGYSNAPMKVLRGFAKYGYAFFGRSAVRMALPADTAARPGLVGLRVVISDVTPVARTLADTLAPYQQNVAASMGAPATVVSGATYADPEGRAFKQVRLTRKGFPSQLDSVVYVSQNPVAGDSAASRQLAGRLAARLSASHGVLYRVSNRYEVSQAGIEAVSGEYYLTIVPAVPYAAGRPHPDVAWKQARFLAAISNSYLASGGPLFPSVNHNAYVHFAPNGDLIGTWYSGITEDYAEQNLACGRLRYGQTSWDAVPSLFADFAGFMDYNSALYTTPKGRLVELHTAGAGDRMLYTRWSLDNGVTWSPYKYINGYTVGKSTFRWGGDTIAHIAEGNRFVVTANDGLSWTWTGNAAPNAGYHPSACILDDGAIQAFNRGGTAVNDSGKDIMWSARTINRGASWTPVTTPFYPPTIGQYDVVLKLHSGRLLMATVDPAAWPGNVVLAESVDSGRTWFCRRRFGTGAYGTGDEMRGYKDLCQTQDGVIHLLGTWGSGTGAGNNPQISFTEEWLRQGAQVPVAYWGISTTGRVSDGSVTEPGYLPAENIAAEGRAAGLLRARPAEPAVAAMPNPFAAVSTLCYDLGGENRGRLEIFRPDGGLAASWRLDAGRGGVSWNSADRAAGLYLARLTTGSGRVKTARLVILR